MAGRTLKMTIRVLRNTSLCMTFWLGSAMAQEPPVKLGSELILSATTSDGVVTFELGLAARYYKQGNYVQAELTYRKIQARMENEWGPNDPRIAAVLRFLAEVNVDLGNYNQAEEIEQR